MLRFAFKVALLGLALLASHLVFYVLLPTDPDSNAYLAAINDKYARLANTPSPKIIFVGTSELAFGLDSVKIEETFGMPVVNLGLHAGIGIRTTLESIRPYIQQGDVVVISAALDPIPDTFFYGYDDGTGQHLWLLKLRPAMLSALNAPYQWKLLVREYPNFIKTMKSIAVNTQFRHFYIRAAVPENAYRRNGFNEQGDLISHLALPPIPAQPLLAEKLQMTGATHPPQIKRSSAAVSYLNEYHVFVKQRGASIYAVWPPLYIPHDSQPLAVFVSQQNIAVYQDDNWAVTIPVLGAPQHYQFPLEFFYEIPGHLGKLGREARTAQLLKDLSPVIRKSTSAQ